MKMKIETNIASHSGLCCSKGKRYLGHIIHKKMIMNHFEVYRFWSNFKHGSHFRNLFVFVVILLRARVWYLFIYAISLNFSWFFRLRTNNNRTRGKSRLKSICLSMLNVSNSMSWLANMNSPNDCFHVGLRTESRQNRSVCRPCHTSSASRIRCKSVPKPTI